MRRCLIGNRGPIAWTGAVAAVAGVLALAGCSGDERVGAVDGPTSGAAPAPAVRDTKAPDERPAHRAAVRRHARIVRAGDWAADRRGRVAFAIAGADGTIHGRNEHETFQAASVVKALILAAELQRVADSGGQLSSAARAELQRMITTSDNVAATSVFARVGPEGLDAIAHRAGMRDFDSSTTWGASEISAADMAAMFSALRRVFPERFERFGLGLLGSITPEQRWGIARVADERGWSVRFKGGWRLDPDGQIVNQAAELRRDGEEQAVVVLTDRQPSMAYGVATVEGVAARLLRG